MLFRSVTITSAGVTTVVSGSTTAAGKLQLTDSTSSTSTTTAATPNAVKSAYDLASAALPKAGGTVTGNIAFSGSGTLTDPPITGCILEDIYTITDGAAFEIDPGNGSIQLITLGANRTPKATNFAAGESVTLMVDDGTAYTLTWSDTTFGTSGVVWKTGSGSAPTLNTTGYTVIVLWKVSSQIYGARVGDA